MKWSLRIARVSGIDIYIHWTFWLLFVYLGLSYLNSGEGLATTLITMGFVVAVFACVVLHELGHALAAQQCGVATRDITLLPIGGIARLERIPEDPRQELWIAAAGPLVNVVIAAVLWLFVPRGDMFEVMSDTPLHPTSFLNNLMRVNVFLVAFNLLPAFPMDGGRMLRAILAHSLGHVRATEIAAGIGQMMAILFGIVGIYRHPMLLFIALFVYLGAEAESRAIQLRNVLANVPVREAMITEFRTLAPEDPLSVAIEELLAGSQQDFPVLDQGQLVGMLWRRKLFRGLQQGGETGLVRDWMEPICAQTDPYERLDAVLQQMQADNCAATPVLQHERLIGLVTSENVLELITIRQALMKRQDSAG